MRYQWLLTLQWQDGPAQRMISRSGIVDAKPGDTRSSLLKKVHDWTSANTGAPRSAVVLFFTLEPEELGG